MVGCVTVELRHLRYLLAVAEHANFTRAAEELHISQPTLSQQVKQLEKALGVQLLDRTGRSVRLTDAGATYLHHAREVLRDLAAGERAVLDVQDLSRGHLRLAVTPTFTAYLVGPLTGEFRAAHPGISLDVREMTQDRIEAALLADELDLGVAFRGGHLPGIDSAALLTESLSLVVGRRHPLARRRHPLPVAEVAEQPLALLSADFATRGHIDAYFAQHRAQVRVAVEANSVTALIEMIRRTDLVTVLPDAITREHPELHPVSLEPGLPTRTACLLRRESAYRSAASRAFVRIARRSVRDGGQS
ncbi:LysR family transcriptional regulator, cyn operon transcriptional activator [Saccharopolyspora kobensis]|uniref:LysR family transcriptional regulator, cyn operon transcriptional activator n=1 Tax=Saccharopolyspora kobensis TaxID=146035 RepID=A0A1H5ZCQ4_9PSEU|nr:LysR family transcriptional regulator, cyn operon transcriptional activator [Saccharopolyspora kobensis]SFF17207.1 LysR family transcriptional regulator, cyn operon transcriptional activator [Saccharopolyspora kobensis]